MEQAEVPEDNCGLVEDMAQLTGIKIVLQMNTSMEGVVS